MIVCSMQKTNAVVHMALNGTVLGGLSLPSDDKARFEVREAPCRAKPTRYFG
jgi:hypothetical protein